MSALLPNGLVHLDPRRELVIPRRGTFWGIYMRPYNPTSAELRAIIAMRQAELIMNAARYAQPAHKRERYFGDGNSRDKEDLAIVRAIMDAAYRRFPWQPIVKTAGVFRWKSNSICAWAVDSQRINMNDVAMQDFSKPDMAQFAQLIGYSISRWGDLNYVRNKDAHEAQEEAEHLFTLGRPVP